MRWDDTRACEVAFLTFGPSGLKIKAWTDRFLVCDAYVKTKTKKANKRWS